MKTREKLESEQAEVTEELRQVSTKYSKMLRTPKYSETFSAVKLDEYQRQREKLEQKQTELQAQLVDLVNSPEYLKSRETKVAQLVAKRDAIFMELEKVSAQLKAWHYTSHRAVAEGSDALKLASEMVALQEKEIVLRTATQLLNSAIQRVSR